MTFRIFYTMIFITSLITKNIIAQNNCLQINEGYIIKFYSTERNDSTTSIEDYAFFNDIPVLGKDYQLTDIFDNGKLINVYYYIGKYFGRFLELASDTSQDKIFEKDLFSRIITNKPKQTIYLDDYIAEINRVFIVYFENDEQISSYSSYQKSSHKESFFYGAKEWEEKKVKIIYPELIIIM